MKDFRINDSYEVAAFTPGLNLVPTRGYSGKINFTLRGVGLNSFSEPQESAVAIYQDEFYLAPLMGSIVGAFDTDQIEVLKGPQGTLFGRSASGGLIHYKSKKPTQETEGYIGLQYGSYDEKHVEAAVGGPLNDSISARVFGYWNEYGG